MNKKISAMSVFIFLNVFLYGQYEIIKENGKYGYADKKGNVIIPCEYDSAGNFGNEGFAEVKKDGKKYLVDREANEYLYAEKIENIKPDTRAVYLSYKHPEEIPDVVFEVKNLKILNLCDNNIKKIPSRIGSLKKLTYLNLEGNSLVGLPEDIKKLKELEVLNLKNNDLDYIPESILNFDYLEKLNLSGNEIKKIPPEIKNLINLKELYLENNTINELPAEITALSRLEELDVSGNPLSEIPLGFNNLKKLKYLLIMTVKEYEYINFNKGKDTLSGSPFFLLKSVCKSFENYERDIVIITDGNIKFKRKSSKNDYLIISILNYFEADSQDALENVKNPLECLPLELFNLSSLKMMILKNEELNDLPSDIKKLKNLEILDLRGNNLSVLPESIRELTELSFLNLKGNNFSEEEREKIKKMLPDCSIRF